MEKTVLDMPAMWADHHVLKVREVLSSMDGVEDVYASSAWKQVLVKYDEAKIDKVAIEQALTQAGYPAGQGAPPMLAESGLKGRDPKWQEADTRVTWTSQVDLEMSGEFRKY
jgi:copper chaperone CopZ